MDTAVNVLLKIKKEQSEMMKKVAIVGSPNVGKSVTFGSLTGSYVTVSNYPGTTVEVARGNAKIGGKICEVIDTPGLYSTYPVTEEERVALELLINERPDVVIHVIDAKNIERMLPLTFQLQRLKLPIILVLNMLDEALSRGMNVNTGNLSQELGVPVVATIAITKQGTSQLFEAIAKLLQETRIGANSEPTTEPFSEIKMRQWYTKAREIATRVVLKTEVKRRLSRLDKIITSPITGLPILAAVIYFGLYKFVGSFGAGTVVDLLEGGFEEYINPWVTHLAEDIIPWELIRELFVGEYGIITLGIRYAVAIILPIVGLFFLVFAVIEDSGYLPRLALLLDRAFKKIGLSGRAIIPMVLGLGCDTMATMVTRTLPTKRERIIATLLLALCIPCSAQIGVILGLLSGVPNVLIAWLIIINGIFIVVGIIMGKLLPGSKPSFIMEIPPMRMPQWKNVLTKTYARMEWYFKEVVPLFAIASLIIWMLKAIGAFEYAVDKMATPLAAMGLPASSAKAFIFGFFRRDYGAAGLYDLHKSGAFTNNQLLIAVTVLTLFLPCITQFLITIKERGWKIGFGISIFVLCFAFVTGIALNFSLVALGISF